jgi:hypothetical protein
MEAALGWGDLNRGLIKKIWVFLRMLRHNDDGN